MPFQCVAASIERAAEHWFTTGPVVDAVLASSAVPGVLPPVRIGDEHYLDGGLVNSIPVGAGADARGPHHVRAAGRPHRPAAAGTDQAVGGRVGRVRDRPPAPVRPRHGERFRPDAEVHVLPTGADDPPRYGDLSTLRYRDFRGVERRIAQAHRATADYLERAPERSRLMLPPVLVRRLVLAPAADRPDASSR